jgi:hypothetical protein
MAVHDSDLPYLNPPGAGASARGPFADSGPQGQSAGQFSSSHTNRPIPLKPRSAAFPTEDEDDEDDLDEESADLREILRNAPAWLVSTVFHMLLLIVLGLLAYGSTRRPDDLEVEVGYAEDLGDQLEDASALATDSQLEKMADEPLVTTNDLTKIEEPVFAPPTLEKIQLTPIDIADPDSQGSSHAAGIDVALSGRGAGTRQGLLKKYGGTKGTESAVELGLAWLAEQQREDGSWSLLGPYSDGGRSENTASATAMALLAFQGHGDTHQEGRYQKTVGKGWKALLSMQKGDGIFSGTMGQQIQMLYTHAQATIAVCEIYGMTNDGRFAGPARRAVKYALGAQDKEKGGWRYQPRMDSDTSVTGWFVMALQSARMANLNVPRGPLQEVMRYLDNAAIDEGRRYGYWFESNSTSAMCAEGLLCRQYLGWPRDDPRLVEGVSALLNTPVAYNSPTQDVYYWYYATQAAHHMEGEIWERWNSRMRDEIPAHQVQKGAETGSWSPHGDKWGNEGGRLYVTCLSIYNLEVYYRHLPIYAGYSAINQLPPIDALDELPDDMPTDAKEAPATDEPPTSEKPDEGKPSLPIADPDSQP